MKELLNETINISNGLFPYILPLLVGGIGYLFVYYFWDPIRKMDSLKQEIITVITRYANVRQRSVMKKNSDYATFGDIYEEVVLNEDEIVKTTHRLRQLAGELRSIINTKKTYTLLSFFHLVPPKSKIESSAKCLIGWSNSYGQKEQERLIGKSINDLAQELRIPIS